MLSQKQESTTDAIRLEIGINQNAKDKALLELGHPLSTLFDGKSSPLDNGVLETLQKAYQCLFFDNRLQPDEIVFAVGPYETSSVARCHYDEFETWSLQVTC